MIPQEIIDGLAAIFLLTGAAFSLIAAIGILRFPDLLSRMHPAAKPQVFGLISLLIGLALRLGHGPWLSMLLLVALFQLFTSPVNAHIMGRAAYRNQHVDTSLLVVDELAEDIEAIRQRNKEFSENE